ncbi:MAG: hypothetical protein LBL86_08085 [Coriobacteriales bacterium]|jgi:hypothetical protein|nr:hypothetical protein [Coriobacteriales bacterium]
MPKKLLVTFVLFVLLGILTFLAGWASDKETVALPQTIRAETPCPVAGCTQPDASCHAAGPAPVPNGTLTMECPRVKGCSETDCHAWSRIETTRSKPSDASMNLWILAPVVLVLVLVAMVRKL